MSNPVKHQRKLSNLIINRDFQLRYVFWLSSSGLALVVINAFVIYRYFRENYFALVELSPMTDEAKAQLFAELHQFLMILIGVSVGFLVVVGFLGVLFSHRVAGPMYHFKRVFNAIREGQSQARVRLRPKDEFQDVAQAFNSMMDQIQKK